MSNPNQIPIDDVARSLNKNMDMIAGNWDWRHADPKDSRNNMETARTLALVSIAQSLDRTNFLLSQYLVAQGIIEEGE